jgi:UDPglucose 6-dehydrogenase
MMQVGVIGTGHVGLVSAVCLAALGHRVVGTDQDGEKINVLKKGRSPFFEAGLDDLLSAGLSNGNLSFTPEPEPAVAPADLVLISVGTPPRATGEANLVAVERAARTVARYATGQCLVVEKSTVPTGTASRLMRTLGREHLGSAELHVASNPEFLREGHAVGDFMEPDRILVGAESDWAFDTMRELYEPLLQRGVPLIETDIATAELAKHASNAFLALRISFVNALARLCERSGADVVAVTKVMGADPRIGSSYLDAGIGYGGSCFPKDLNAFERLASQLGYEFPLLSEIARLNDEAVRSAFDKVKDALWNLEDKTVALLGLAFRPGTDDSRFAPALRLASLLLDEGASVVAYDPKAGPSAKASVPEIHLAKDPYEAATGAHCLVVCTEWGEFVDLDLARLRGVMGYPIIVDGRNVFEPEEVAASGFSYYPTGRQPVHQGD